MLRNLQQSSRRQRVLVFLLLFGGGLLALLAISAALLLGALNSAPRTAASALVEGLIVREFAALPGEDGYPAFVAAAPDGTIYTASYKTGAVYRIGLDAAVTEIPATRDAIGAAAGLVYTPDGRLLVVDHVDSDIRTSGGSIKQLLPDGQISDFAAIPDERGFVLPFDITLDGRGYVYVSDRGRDEVWRFNPDGSGALAWWSPPGEAGGGLGYEPGGLAYDPARDALLVADGALNIIYRVLVADGTTETLYRHTGQADAPGFGGLTVTPDGTIYAAALGLNRVLRLDGGQLTPIAGNFRGASDVTYAAPGRLFVTNFDQRSLAFTLERPRLPFALDVIEPGESRSGL